jgi:hypothetical protein
MSIVSRSQHISRARLVQQPLEDGFSYLNNRNALALTPGKQEYRETPISPVVPFG